MKELEDLEFFPSFLRDDQTAFIGFVVSAFPVYKPFVKILSEDTSKHATMFDLCSGSGEPAISIFNQCKAFSKLILSDKYPSSFSSKNPDINYLPASVDVLEFTPESNTCFTMFNAFHHFDDKEKIQIIDKIHKSGSNAYFVEILQPNLICLIKVILAGTIGVIVLSPFIRPFSLRRFFFTYIIPINLFTITFDGCISVLKSRSLKQYRRLFVEYGEKVEIISSGSALAPLTMIKIINH